MVTSSALQLVCRPRLSLAHLRQVHAVLLTSSLLADRFFPNKLLRSLLPAQPLSALRAFPRLRRILPAFRPNNYTFSFLLTAAASSASSEEEEQGSLVSSLHALAVTLGSQGPYVSNGFIHAYASRGLLASARRIFHETLSSGRADVCSWTSLLTAYARAGQLEQARALFDGMPHRRNDVCWSAMISAHVAVGGPGFADALHLFQDMLSCGMRPNRAALVGALAACGALGALDQGSWLHAYYLNKNKSLVDGVVGTALVDMYAKCGSLDAATQVFQAMPLPSKDVFAYTAMISGLSDHGRCREAIRMFRQMQERGVRPNAVTFICVLTACARAGLVHRARHVFRTIPRPGVEHYGCLVDVLGRAGLVDEALHVVQHRMPMRPDSYVLGALLNACTAHGRVELGRQVMAWMADLGLLDRHSSGAHVQLSNMYAGSSNWDRVLTVRSAMEMEVLKLPGCSMVEVDGVACEFVAGDRSHPRITDIMSTLAHLHEPENLTCCSSSSSRLVSFVSPSCCHSTQDIGTSVY